MLDTFLIFHKRPILFEPQRAKLEGDLPARFLLIPSIEKLLEQLKGATGLLVHWEESQQLFTLFEKLPHDTLILAFSQEWKEPSLARALQLGTQIIFWDSPEPSQFLEELEVFREEGLSPSRRKLLLRFEGRLLRSTPQLWERGNSPERRDLFIERAKQNLKSLSQEEQAWRLFDLLRLSEGRPPSRELLEALLKVTEGHKISSKLGSSRLHRLSRLSRSNVTGEPSEILRRLLNFKGLDRDTSSPEHQELRSLAAKEVLSGEQELQLLPRLRTLLGLSSKLWPQIDQKLRELLREQLLLEPEQELALDMIRLVFLSNLFSEIKADGLGKRKIFLLAELLGCGQENDLRLEGLQAAVGLIESEDVLLMIQQAPIKEINHLLAILTARAIPSALNALELARRLNHLMFLVHPNGHAAQVRLVMLVDAMERQQECTIPQPSRQVLSYSLKQSNIRRGRASTLLWQALGLIKKEQEKRICDFLDSLPEKSNFNTLDLNLLIQSSKDEQHFQRFSAEFKGRGLGAPERWKPVQLAAQLIWTFQFFGLDIETSQACGVEALGKQLAKGIIEPSKNPIMISLLIFIGLLKNCKDSERRTELFKQGLKGQALNLPLLVQLQEILEEEDEQLLLQLRTLLGLPLEPPCYKELEQLLERDELSGVLLGIEELSREDKRIVPLLNKLALRVQAQGADQLAVQLYLRALKLQPRRVSLSLNLAELYLKMGKREAAQRLLEALEERLPGLAAVEEMRSKLW